MINLHSSIIFVMLSIFSFMDIIPDKPDLFSEQMHFDLTVFKGVIAKTDHCKMKNIDFRGFSLSKYICIYIYA